MPRTEWLRPRPEIGFAVHGVDRPNRVIRGYVAAQEGPFKDPRGEFDRIALEALVAMGNQARGGLKSRFGHPSMSGDAVGKHLGRARNFRMSTAVDARTGVEVLAVRGDLYFDQTAHKTPSGDLAGYVMDLAESDPGAISSSFVLEVREEPKLDARGKQITDEYGEPVPPLWRPTKLHASDIVDVGAAADAILEPDELCKVLGVNPTAELKKLLRFDNVQRLGCRLLDGLFPKADRDEVERRCRDWLNRYIDGRFGDPQTPQLDARRLKLDAMALEVRRQKGE